MIGYLSGKIFAKRKDALVVLCGGVGYLVLVPRELFESAKVGTDAEFFVYTRVAETALDLFGFASEDDLTLFKLLITVSGVGPKTALEIMAVPTAKLKSAILSGDPAQLSGVKGVGKKTAEKICLELKDKMDILSVEPEENVVSPAALDEDALAALISLGYDRRSSEATLKKCPPDITTTEARIRWSLANF